LQAYAKGGEFVIGHFGSLSPTRHLGPAIAALEMLVQQRPEIRAFLRLDLYGGPLDPVSAGLLSASTIGALVRHHGRIEQDPVTGLSGRDQILQRMRSSDLLLLLHGEDAICSEYIPSKIYEYLWMQRPIVAVVHSNTQLADMLHGLGHTCVMSAAGDGDRHRESSQLCRAVEQHADEWLAGALPDNLMISPYTTAAAAARLRGYVGECLALHTSNLHPSSHTSLSP
jgi:hypothetical protein